MVWRHTIGCEGLEPLQETRETSARQGRVPLQHVQLRMLCTYYVFPVSAVLSGTHLELTGSYDGQKGSIVLGPMDQTHLIGSQTSAKAERSQPDAKFEIRQYSPI